MILNVEPGKKRWRYAAASNGFPGFDLRASQAVLLHGLVVAGQRAWVIARVRVHREDGARLGDEGHHCPRPARELRSCELLEAGQYCQLQVVGRRLGGKELLQLGKVPRDVRELLVSVEDGVVLVL